MSRQSFSRRREALGSTDQPAGLWRERNFRHGSRAIWFKIVVKAAMLISYIGLYFLITVPEENLVRRRGEKLASQPSVVHLKKV